MKYKIKYGQHYVVYEPNHPSAGARGRVCEHIVIAEKALGKFMPKGAEVHHLDGNPFNNTPNNLVICENHEYHYLLHVRQRALKACGNSHWRKCWVCKKHDDPVNLCISKKGVHHKICLKNKQHEYWKNYIRH